MERILSLRAHCEYFPDDPRLHHLHLPKPSTTEPARISGSQLRPSLHAGHQLRDQHKPSTLQWRRSLQHSAKLLFFVFFVIYAGTLLPEPDDSRAVSTVHERSHRPMRGDGDDSRLYRSESEFGKLLHRLCSISNPTLPSVLLCRSPHSCWTGRSSDNLAISDHYNSRGCDS